MIVKNVNLGAWWFDGEIISKNILMIYDFCIRYVTSVYDMSLLCTICHFCVRYVTSVYDMSLLCTICHFCVRYVTSVYDMSLL